MQKSVYLTAGITDKNLELLNTLSINSIFINSKLLDVENTSKLKNSNPSVQINAVLNVFEGKELLDMFPDALAVESSGKSTQTLDYVGLCPTHPGVRAHVLDELRRVLSFGVDNIWLDHINYPTKWNVPEPAILDTCYCSRCIKLFEDFIGEKINGVGGEGSELETLALHIDGSYYHEWLTFKTGYITLFARDAKELVTQSGKSLKLGIFAIPWDNTEFGDAITRVLSQDLGALSVVVDMFSPMLYHQDCAKDLSWVKEKVAYFWNFGTVFFATISINSDIVGQTMSANDFAQALENAATKPSSGVCVINLESMAVRQDLLDVFRKFCADS